MQHDFSSYNYHCWKSFIYFCVCVFVFLSKAWQGLTSPKTSFSRWLWSWSSTSGTRSSHHRPSWSCKVHSPVWVLVYLFYKKKSLWQVTFILFMCSFVWFQDYYFLMAPLVSQGWTTVTAVTRSLYLVSSQWMEPRYQERAPASSYPPLGSTRNLEAVLRFALAGLSWASPGSHVVQINGFRLLILESPVEWGVL